MRVLLVHLDVVVKATPSQSDAFVHMPRTTLVLGTNELVIKVDAADNSSTLYTIVVTRPSGTTS
jgi:hypothetical protein